MSSNEWTKETQATLEDLIDKSSLTDVLNLLANICNEKADHLRSDWQDEQSAKGWERDAAKLDKLSLNN